MLKTEMKAALAFLGAVFAPLFAQADQSMSMSQGQQQQQPGYVSGEMVKAGQLPGAFNQSAAYVSDEGWDVFITADYILWHCDKDRKSWGFVFKGLESFSSTSNLDLKSNGIDLGYASGFQVGMGFNMKGMDDWNFYGEYTWYKNSGSGSGKIKRTLPSLTIDMDSFKEVSLAYNNADFLLQRSFYFGKKLTSNFYTGLRALWINTKSSSNLSGSLAALSSIVTADITNAYINENSSWALGPKFGLDSSWLLGYGLKFLSNISTSVLYTRYTGHTQTDNVGSGRLITELDLTGSSYIHESNYGTLRPVIETYLGLGWGSYFCDNNCHLDLSVGYDFNVHFDYVTMAVAPSNPSNLYLHGLNIQARFDF